MTASQMIALKYLRTKFKLLSAVSKKTAAKQAFELFCTPTTRNRNPLPPIFVKAEIIKFSFEGFHIQGYRWNQHAKKKLLILHGFESSVINFDKYIRPLINKGYEVLAFDAPANGRSSGNKINILIYKRFIQHIIKQFGPVNAFMAHSLGGLALMICLEEMKFKEKPKVVLIAPATETTTAIDAFFSYLELDDNLRAEFENVIAELGENPAEWYSISRVIKEIDASVLWLHDEDDKTTPYADAEKVKDKNYPHVTFVTTKGLGHSRIYRDPKISQQVIDFF
jgi:pimeloyl-ACP methyl ester carboxylesterase